MSHKMTVELQSQTWKLRGVQRHLSKAGSNVQQANAQLDLLLSQIRQMRASLARAGMHLKKG